MKNSYLINPAALNDVEADILQAYIAQHKDFSGIFFGKDQKASYTFFYKNIQIIFQLTNTMVRREKSKLNNEYQYTEFSVIGGEVGRGRFGVVNDVIGTLSFQIKPVPLFSYKPKFQRLISKTEHHFLDRSEIHSEKEYEFLMLTDHSHPKLYRYFADESKSILIAKKFSGHDLQYIIDQVLSGKKKLSVDKRFRLSVNLLRALKTQVHDKLIIHRDIKPDNIIVNDHLDVCIIDYGLSRYSGQKHNDGISCGTITYVAPDVLIEDARGNANLDERSDVFSMGKVLGQIWGADDPLIDGLLTHRREVLHYLNKNPPPILFKQSLIFNSLTDVERAVLLGVVSHMMTSSRSGRMKLEDAIMHFEQLRLHHLARSIPLEYKKNLFEANVLSVRTCADLYSYRKSITYTLGGMINIIANAVFHLPDNDPARQEFLAVTGLRTTMTIKSNDDLLRQLQFHLDTIDEFKKKFKDLMASFKEQFQADHYLSSGSAGIRFRNYAHVLILLKHELNKLSLGRRDVSDLERLHEKLNRKFEFFKRIQFETAFISAWNGSADLNEIKSRLEGMLADPAFSSQNQQLKHCVIQSAATFIRHSEARAHHIFHQRSIMSKYAVRYISHLVSAVVAISDEHAFLQHIESMKPQKGLKYLPVHHLHRSITAAMIESKSCRMPLALN